jgi:hypothetical protein
VWASMIFHRNNRTGEITVGLERFAKETGATIPSVCNALKRLEQRGIIETLSRGGGRHKSACRRLNVLISLVKGKTSNDDCSTETLLTNNTVSTGNSIDQASETLKPALEEPKKNQSKDPRFLLRKAGEKEVNDVKNNQKKAKLGQQEIEDILDHSCSWDQFKAWGVYDHIAAKFIKEHGEETAQEIAKFLVKKFRTEKGIENKGKLAAHYLQNPDLINKDTRDEPDQSTKAEQSTQFHGESKRNVKPRERSMYDEVLAILRAARAEWLERNEDDRPPRPIVRLTSAQESYANTRFPEVRSAYEIIEIEESIAAPT